MEKFNDLWTINHALKIAVPRLLKAGCDTPQLDAELLLAHTLTQERTWLYLYPTHTLTALQQENFLDCITRREQREPLAYIVGHKAFFGLDFLVNSHVLIPRPETEHLVETALELRASLTSVTPGRRRAQDPMLPGGNERLQSSNEALSITGQNRRLKIVDVCTGSGCIAVTLVRHLAQAMVTAIDISPEALAVAKQNAARYDVLSQITFVEGDLLQPVTESVDLIVSNPPYVSQPELAVARPEVQQYEPSLALAGGVVGLAVIKRLLQQAQERLKPKGCLLVEIGYEQGPAVKQLAQVHFPHGKVSIKKDLAGLDRLLIVVL